MTSLEVLKYVSGGSILIPALMSLFRWPTLVRRFPTLLAYVWLVVLVESYGTYGMMTGIRNTTPVFNFFSLGELTLLSLLYHRHYDRAVLRAFALGCIAVYVPLALYRYLKQPYGYDGLVMSVEYLMLILLVLLYFYRLLNNLEASRLSRFPMFWFSAGILMFFAGSLFLYMFGNYLVTKENYPKFDALWNVSYYVNIVFHLCVAVGIHYTRPAEAVIG